ncbi:peptidase inhibitor family I36 protein [Saccharothrix lopnurensis]|uniref:Peptidase inhibitor family I36 protein n=1 Tax=Saccharothrix lopnurensis TaxID=1670621 RepID=A0ABW1P960_9PSEU
MNAQKSIARPGVLGALLALLFTLPATAQATASDYPPGSAGAASVEISASTPRNGVCEVGEFCLYYGLNMSGSVSDFNGSVPDYGSSPATCYTFRGPGAGQGQCVKNNAMSARNKTTANRVTVYFNSNYGGISDTYLPGEAGNLIPAMQNENASHRFVNIGS